MKVATSSSRTCTDSAMSSLMAFGCPSAIGRFMENTVKLGIPRSSEMVTRGFASRIKVISRAPCGGDTYATLVASSICLIQPKDKELVAAGDFPCPVEPRGDKAVLVARVNVADFPGKAE